MLCLKNRCQLIPICLICIEQKLCGPANLFNQMTHATRLGSDLCEVQGFRSGVQKVAKLELGVIPTEVNVSRIEVQETVQCSTATIVSRLVLFGLIPFRKSKRRCFYFSREVRVDLFHEIRHYFVPPARRKEVGHSAKAEFVSETFIYRVVLNFFPPPSNRWMRSFFASAVDGRRFFSARKFNQNSVRR
jgi:hypothetical protein